MKLRRLTIHNIASITDAVIDFDREPLASSDVFLISGKTGSGKSTILDAISLALYGKTPRLEHSSMEGKRKDADRLVSVTDPRGLLRQNTGEGGVTLTFLGTDGMEYEASWSITRARGKVGGNLQGKTWKLKNLSTGDAELTKDTEIRAGIEKAVGLDFDQFCRTTMLAQGEFTRFLNSKDDEKAAILEKITGAGIYSRIGAKIYQIFKEKEDAYSKANSAVGDVILLTDAQKQEKADRIISLQKDIDGKNVAKKEADGKMSWLRTDGMLSSQKEAALRRKDEAEAVTSSENFLKDKKTVSGWNATVDARTAMGELERSRKEREKLEAERAVLQEDTAAIEGGLAFLKDKEAGAKAELKEIEDRIAAVSGKAEIYANRKGIGTLVSQVSAGKKKISAISGDVKLLQNKISGELKDNADAAEKAFEGAKAELDARESARKSAEKALEESGLARLRLNKENATERKGFAETAQRSLSAYMDAESKRNQAIDALKTKASSIEEKKKELEGLDRAAKDAREEMDRRQQALDAQKDTIDKFARLMRSHLHTGDTCPVCRQRIVEELPSEEALTSLIEQLEEPLAAAKKVWEDADAAYRSKDAEVKTDEKQLAADRDAIAKDCSVEKAKETLLSDLAKLGMTGIDDNLEKTLKDLAESLGKTISNLNEKIKAAETIEKQLSDCRKAESTAIKALEAAKDARTAAGNKISEAQADIKAREAEIETTKQTVISSSDKIQDFLKDSTWNHGWSDDPEGFLDELKDEAGRYDGWTAVIGPKQALLYTLKRDIETVGNELAAIYGKMPGWKETGEVRKKEIDRIGKAASELKDKVLRNADRVEALTSREKEEQGRLDTFFEQHPEISAGWLDELYGLSKETIDKVSKTVTDAENAFRDAVSAVSTIAGQIEEHLKQKPDFKEGENADTLGKLAAAIDAEIQAIMKEQAGIKNELEEDEKRQKGLETLIRERDEKKAVYDKWGRIKNLLGDADGDTFRKIAQSYVLDSLIHEANIQLMKLSGKRYQMRIIPGSFVILLEDAYLGNAARPASTISGGESFLVSLSLALALSGIGEGIGVDTLFIDEGFGTLSGEPLQNAITTLRTLKTDAHKHVGIISHIEELQEEIPVQIKVEQEGNNSSSTVKVVTL